MAYASCRSCKRAANESTCPDCGGVMIADEEFGAEDGGPYPALPFRQKQEPKRRPSFFSKDEAFEMAVRDFEKEHARRPKALELAILGIEAEFGKGSINVGRT